MQSSRYSAKARLAVTCCGLPYPKAFATFKKIFSVVGDDFTFRVSQLCDLVVVNGEPGSTGEFAVVRYRQRTVCVTIECRVGLRLRMNIERTAMVSPLKLSRAEYLSSTSR